MNHLIRWVILTLAAAALFWGCEDDGRVQKISTGTLALSGEFRFSKTPPGLRQTRTVSIENVGKRDVTLTRFVKRAGEEIAGKWTIVSRDGKVLDGGDDGLPQTVHIGPGASLRLSLTFSPETPSPPRGTIQFKTNSGIQTQRSISLPIGGLKASGELHVSHNPVQFGRVPVGGESEKTVTITNFGTDTILLEKLAVHGSSKFSVRIGDIDPQQDPTILRDPDGDGAPGIKPDGQVQLRVLFRPSGDHSETGELQITSDAHIPKVMVALLGNADAPCVRVTPSPISFPPTAIGAERAMVVRIESCGAQAVTVNALELGSDSSGFRLGSNHNVPIELPGTSVADFQPPGVDVVLFFKPDGAGSYEGRLLVRSTDSEHPEMEIQLTGSGVENQCPTPRIATESHEVRPLDVVALDGSASRDPDGPNERPVEYRWFMIDRPMGSTSQPVESLFDPSTPGQGGEPDVTSTPTARFFVDLAGEYTLELRVIDHHGAQAPSDLCPVEPARMHIKAVPNEALHIQLTWDTPGDADQTDDQGTDVDLHLRHPQANGWSGFDELDCYYQNQSPDWGRQGEGGDDPSLDIDDVNGAGPENINIMRPESTGDYERGYLVGVHYYSADQLGGSGGLGEMESTARVRIFVDGQVAYEGERLLRQTDDMWTVAEIEFAGRRGRVNEINTIGVLQP